MRRLTGESSDVVGVAQPAAEKFVSLSKSLKPMISK